MADKQPPLFCTKLNTDVVSLGLKFWSIIMNISTKFRIGLVAALLSVPAFQCLNAMIFVVTTFCYSFNAIKFWFHFRTIATLHYSRFVGQFSHSVAKPKIAHEILFRFFPQSNCSSVHAWRKIVTHVSQLHDPVCLSLSLSLSPFDATYGIQTVANWKDPIFEVLPKQCLHLTISYLQRHRRNAPHKTISNRNLTNTHSTSTACKHCLSISHRK